MMAASLLERSRFVLFGVDAHEADGLLTVKHL